MKAIHVHQHRQIIPSDIHNRLVVKPQLVRRREVINTPKAVAPATLHRLSSPPPVPANDVANRLIAAQQQSPKAQTVVQPARSQQRPIVTHKPVLQPILPAAVANRPRALPHKQGGRRKPVRYITANNTSLDVERIGNIRNIGRGKVLVIVGNGPSVAEVPTDRLKDNQHIDLMSINRPDSRVWPTRFWAYFDTSQQARNQALWQTYDGLIFNSPSIKQRRPNTIQLKNIGAHGFSRNLQEGFNIGQSSVYAAMQIGLWMGYDHIYILGCDMCEVNGKLHYYGVNPDVAATDRKQRFAAEAAFYDEAVKILTDDERRRFTFCSRYNPYGFVERFNRIDHTACIYEILDHARQLDVRTRQAS